MFFRDGKHKEQALRKLEDDLGLKVEYHQISDWVEKKQKKKYEFKVEQEKRIRAEQQLKHEREQVERERSLRLEMERKAYMEKRQEEERIRAKMVRFFYVTEQAIEERAHFSRDSQGSSFVHDHDPRTPKRESPVLQGFDDIPEIKSSGYRRLSGQSDGGNYNYLTPNTNNDYSLRERLVVDRASTSPFEQPIKSNFQDNNERKQSNC
jgi:hypothetical protein